MIITSDPKAIAQVRLFNMHPTGKMNRDERLEGLLQEDGITNCGNAKTVVCPMNIPLTRAIYEENREAVIWFVRLAEEVTIIAVYPKFRNYGLFCKQSTSKLERLASQTRHLNNAEPV